MGFKCIIHQMKGTLLLYLLVYLLLRINMQVKKIYRNAFCYLIVSVYFSTNNVIGSLKCCIYARKIYVEGTESQIVFVYLSCY